MAQPTFEVSINGETHQVPGPITVSELLDHLKVDRRHVGVERNRKLVMKEDYDRVEVAAGDAYEIVTFVGGG